MANKHLLPWLVAVAFFMEMLDTTILNTAVPAVAQALKVPPLNMKAVLASYTLSLAVFIPISGWMADRFGTRRVFASAIAIFILGSFLCGISTNIHQLVASRILQGCGGAMMLPVGRIVIARTFAKSELIRAMSLVAIPGLIGPMLGPIAGGTIVAYFHWGMIFFVNIPIGLIGLYLVLNYLPNYIEKDSPPLDLIGLLFFGSGISLLSYVLEVFGEHTLNNTEITALLLICVFQLVGYELHSIRIRNPLLRLKLFRIRTFFLAVIGSWFTRLGIGGIPFLFPLLSQIGLGYTPIQAGLLMVPQAFAAMSIKLLLASIIKKLGYRYVLIINTLLMGTTILLFSTIGLNTAVWKILLLMFCFGLFSSLQFTTMNTLVFADVVEKDTSSASTIASTAQQLSMSFAVAVASIAAVLFIPNHRLASSQQFIHGIQSAFVLLGLITIISSLWFARLKDDDGC